MNVVILGIDLGKNVCRVGWAPRGRFWFDEE
jgi:hypothetical protein